MCVRAYMISKSRCAAYMSMAVCGAQHLYSHQINACTHIDSQSWSVWTSNEAWLARCRQRTMHRALHTIAARCVSISMCSLVHEEIRGGWARHAHCSAWYHRSTFGLHSVIATPMLRQSMGHVCGSELLSLEAQPLLISARDLWFSSMRRATRDSLENMKCKYEWGKLLQRLVSVALPA